MRINTVPEALCSYLNMDLYSEETDLLSVIGSTGWFAMVL